LLEKPLSVGRRLKRGQTRWQIFQRLLTRALFLALYWLYRRQWFWRV